ncbi:hypothetical protein AB0L35_23405 [Streptomyces sp. NPDC052309]|uniref:DUF3806 domain-containing protein n=1 Tax=Streptomyces griseicoloratus TaxID=2752516 RepID=A0A926L7U6_9ACTN|nr:hypothetical protein [Streptomyces griseicoloratus]MBD0423166.1 hypothetical protein [Streptomyces griseicoloratus]
MDEVDGGRPRAGEMRAHAAAFVGRATARNRLPLDYSPASLRIVDFLIDGLRKGGADHERARGTLLGLGAYAGEVLVRRAGAVWVDFDDGQRAYFGQPVGVRMPDGRVWNPLGKVHNRLVSGAPEESLLRFYLTLHGRARRDRPAVA